MGELRPSHAPFVRSQPLWGRTLRHALLHLLLRSDRPQTPTALVGRLQQAGYRIEATDPAKTVAAALAHEVRRGRARRPRYGHYEAGPISRSMAYRVARRWNHAVDDAPGHPASLRRNGQPQHPPSFL